MKRKEFSPSTFDHPTSKQKVEGAIDPNHLDEFHIDPENDIMYQDDLVCILRPDVKKGIIIWTNYTQPALTDSLCDLGLKTGKQLESEGIEFGRIKIHPYIFFRAPYYSRDIDYTSVETEIISSYGEVGKEPRIFIRVDPDRTFVFSSEIRTKSEGYVNERLIMNSKKTLSKYLQIINGNMKIKKDAKPEQTIWYNLFGSQAVLFPTIALPPFPFDNEPIERNSEILVSIPHLTPDYFVLCAPTTPVAKGKDRKLRSKRRRSKRRRSKRRRSKRRRSSRRR